MELKDMKLLNRTGEEYVTNEGYPIKVIEYINRRDCTIQFQNGHIIKNIDFTSVRNGSIKNPFHPSIYNIGYFGLGTHKSSTNNKKTKTYTTWKSMLSRCYEIKHLNNYPTYKDVTVCKEWHNFQNFVAWFEENWKPWMDSSWHLDKDVICKECKIYSPETCAFIPLQINLIGFKEDKITTIPMRKDKYVVQCSNKELKKVIKCFDNKNEAVLFYKEIKESHIKSLAEEWKNLIDKRVYNILNNYKV